MILENISLPVNYTQEDLERAVKKALGKKKVPIRSIRLLKRSLDARKKPVLKYVVKAAVNEPEEKLVIPRLKVKRKYVVAGAGPAGLFASLVLSQAGAEVILAERGKDVDSRTEDVYKFFETGVLDPSSNVQFGEGGAGTFSDGKLNTLIKDKEHYGAYVLETFHRFGAKEEILYDAKPHIGTDELTGIIRNFRNELVKNGVDIRFSTCLTDLEIRDGKLTGVYLNDRLLSCDGLVLCIGHSARDTLRMLYDKGLLMEQKAFAIGLRLEHPQEMITMNQYGTLDYEELGAAPYKVTARTSNGRGVYSFCMCPGGYVVNASSEPGRLCVNGMSLSRRDSGNANAGIVVQVTPDDYPGDDPLDGVRFQEELEKKAYDLADGSVPVQQFGDFIRGKASEKAGSFPPKILGEYAFTNLNGLLPLEVEKSIREGIQAFGKKIPGFDREDALLSAVESRTSSPVRIVRNESGQASISGIYPAGEGAGYAGGIMSAAIDGIRTALKIAEEG